LLFGPSHADKVATRLGVPLLGRIPLQPQIAEHANAGKLEEYTVGAFDPVAERLIEALR